MSIEQEIKCIIDSALASHSQNKEVEDLREKVEELNQQVKRLSQARDADMNAIQSSILNIKQGEVFISPATISGGIVFRAQGELKTTLVDFHIVNGKGEMICRMERPSSHDLSEKIKELSAYDVDAKLKFIAALMPTELLKSI